MDIKELKQLLQSDMKKGDQLLSIQLLKHYSSTILAKNVTSGEQRRKKLVVFSILEIEIGKQCFNLFYYSHLPIGTIRIVKFLFLPFVYTWGKMEENGF